MQDTGATRAEERPRPEARPVLFRMADRVRYRFAYSSE